MITVKFFTLLRLHLKLPQIQIELPGGPVAHVLAEAQRQIATPFLATLLDDAGNLKTGTIILLNGKNIFHLDHANTLVRDNDVLSLFPPGGGG